MNDILAVDLIKGSPEVQADIRKAVYTLSDTRAFNALLEILTDLEYYSPDKLTGFEQAALNASFNAGYVRAIKELIKLGQLSIETEAVQKQVSPDYGALETLLQKKEITEEEYNILKNEELLE